MNVASGSDKNDCGCPARPTLCRHGAAGDRLRPCGASGSTTSSASLAFYLGTLGLAPVRVDQWRRGEAPFPSVRVNERDDSSISSRAPADHSGPRKRRSPVSRGRTHGLARGHRGRRLLRWSPDRTRCFGAQGEGEAIYVRDPDRNLVELRYYDTQTDAHTVGRVTTVEAPIRLTSLAAGGGCACKIPPGELEEAVRGLAGQSSPNLVVGLDSGDDAAVTIVAPGPRCRLHRRLLHPRRRRSL